MVWATTLYPTSAMRSCGCDEFFGNRRGGTYFLGVNRLMQTYLRAYSGMQIRSISPQVLSYTTR